MAYTPYQPYVAYPFQQGYPNYIPQRPEQQPYNAPQPPIGAPQAVQMQNPINSTPAAQTGFLCRPVTSKEEALAVQADYLSAGTIMPDLGHGMIYMKRFDANTGLSNFFEFGIVQPQQQQPDEPATAAVTTPDYSETFRAFGEQLGSVSSRIDELSSKIDAWKPKQTSKKGASEE